MPVKQRQEHTIKQHQRIPNSVQDVENAQKKTVIRIIENAVNAIVCIILKNIALLKIGICQYRNPCPHGIRKASSYRSRKQSPHQFRKQSLHRHIKQNIEKKNVNATYKTEYDPDQQEEDLYLNTIKNGDKIFNYNNSKEIFAIINCQDLYGKKHKIKMKTDTRADGNILPLRIYKKMYLQNVHKNIDRPISVKTEQTTLWTINGTNISQYGSMVLNIKHKNGVTIQPNFLCVRMTQ